MQRDILGIQTQEAIFAFKHSMCISFLLLLRHVMSAPVAWQGWFHRY